MKRQGGESKETALEAISRYKNESSTAFVCPFPECGVYALHHWGYVGAVTIPHPISSSVFRQTSNDPVVRLAQCEACNREVVFAGLTMIWPMSTSAPSPHADMPEDCIVDYKEAMGIAAKSPRGSAALLRLALEKLLPHIGATAKGIDKAIGELVARGVVPQRVQQALDAVRVIGNEAVHPGELDLRDDDETVAALFWLMNFIVEKAIAEPREIDRVYSQLPPGKLAGIANRDTPKPTP